MTMSLYGLTKESIRRCVIIVSIFQRPFLYCLQLRLSLHININGGFVPFSGTGLLVAVTLLIE